MDPSLKEESSNPFSRLQHIVTTLRGKDGCPWDIKQTPESLRKYLLEECQELVVAIDNADAKEICEEIGDVLFVLTLLITMFTEQQQFTSDDVFEQITAKMIRRHPHVFSGTPLADDHDLRAQWERIKAQEKQSPTSSHS
jgi:nucleoside triphosphate diphosphatase